MENERTKIIGVYSEKYKGGPVLKTKDCIIYLEKFPENRTYEGKTLEVTGKLYEDKEHVVAPYKEGEIVSQGWAQPRTVMEVKSFKIIK